jgi:AraC-like DNA-binding protein
MTEESRRLRHDCGRTCLPTFFTNLESKLESPLLQRAFESLKDDPSAFVSVGEWANEVGVSREHLTRSISPIINPHALLQSARVAIALSRLSGQDKLRAGEALDAMGYSSRAHAFAVFKKTTGLTPTQFWARLHTPDAKQDCNCILDFCPLLGAVLDRYWRTHSDAKPAERQEAPSLEERAERTASTGAASKSA